MATESVPNVCLANCIFYRWDKRRFIRDVYKVKKLERGNARVTKRLAVALWRAWKRKATSQEIALDAQGRAYIGEWI